MSGWHIALLLVAGLAAGAVNAVAGGGTLLTFPALLATGLGPVAANVTNTVAVWPGYLSSAAALRGQWQDRRTLRRLAVAAGCGGVIGTVVLLSTPSSVFRALVPWLVFAATGLLAAQPWISARLAARTREPGHSSPLLPGAVFLAAVYGAYFGGGLGIVLLAVLAVLALGLPEDLGRLNALKVTLSLLINTVALVGFALFGPVDWPAALIIAPATFAGGLVGARIARRLEPRVLRVAVVVFGLGVGLRLLLA